MTHAGILPGMKIETLTLVSKAMNEQHQKEVVNNQSNNAPSAMRHLTLPIFIKSGVFLYPERHVDRLAPVGALLAEAIEFRPIRLTAQCRVVVQLADDKTDHFSMPLAWDEQRQTLTGVGISRAGHAIDIALSDATVEMSINAPDGIAVVSDRHLLNGLIEKSMETKIELAAHSLTWEAAYSKDGLSSLSIDELLRRYAMLDELHCYAKRRVHHWRIGSEHRTQSTLCRSQLFKTVADHLSTQLSLVRAEIARHIQPNFVELYLFHQSARQFLPRNVFKALSDRAKGDGFSR